MPNLSIYIVTFNCGRCLVDSQEFAAALFPPVRGNGTTSFPDIIVLSLQEVAPIGYAFLGPSFLSTYYQRFIDSVQIASSPEQDYQLLICRTVGMTGLVILAKPNVLSTLRIAETAGVGVGVSEMANKGAVGVRVGLGTGVVKELTFVAAHLSPHEWNVERRNQDWENIVRGLSFQPEDQRVVSSQLAGGETEPLLNKSSPPGRASEKESRSMFTSESLLFFAGDLNYRTSDSAPDSDAYKKFPAPNLDSLDTERALEFKASDQLDRERAAGRTMNKLTEAKVEFPPTYKYSTSQSSAPQTDSKELPTRTWARHRYPSWCDRIMFSDFMLEEKSSFKINSYRALPLLSTSDHRPVALSFDVDTDSTSWSDVHGFRSIEPPFPIDHMAQQRRDAAKNKEFAVGVMAYFALTWEGNGVLFASLVGAVGGYYVLSSLL